MTRPLRLGILTWRKGSYVEELSFFTHLAKEAGPLNTEVVIFSPADQLPSGKIQGLLYMQDQGWKPRCCPPPDLVYDRFRNMQPQAFRQFVRFRDESRLTFINSRLAHKWNLYRFLQTQPAIVHWLPETRLFEHPQDVEELLKRYPAVYVKPVNGTGGKGILAVSRQDHTTYHVLGRDQQRKKIRLFFSKPRDLSSYLLKWTQGTKYIVQQGLNLEWQPGIITDFRLLVQKDGQGKWSITGLGGKIGTLNSATSNLHGGGKAIHPDLFLRRYLSQEKRLALYEECRELGLLVARSLEAKFGRLVELGIDLGLDKAGKLWLIEVNSKPGRDIFRQMGDLETYRKAVRAPIEYARYLYERKEGDS